MRLSDVDQLFTPSAVAVFGASDSEGSIGGQVFRNLLAGSFKGQVYAINPKYQEVAGKPCYPDLETLDKHVDLALIATPAERVADILDHCGAAGVRVAVVFSAGFGEQGERGGALQETAGGGGAAQSHPGARTQLPGGHAPPARAKRQRGRGYAPARQRGPGVPVRGHLYRHDRLVGAASARALRRGLPGRGGGRGLRRHPGLTWRSTSRPSASCSTWRASVTPAIS